MSWSMVKSASWGAATLMGAALLAGPALADGMPTRGKVAAPGSRVCSTTATVGITSDYVFRGVSQSGSDAAFQGGVELSCGKFYAGFAGSSVDDWANPDSGAELDFYGGYKTTLGRFSIDLGFIYYTYPGSFSSDANFFEVKAGASTEVWKGGTVGATVFYSPEYTFNQGAVATYEVGLTQALPKVGMFTPTFSALYGYSDLMDADTSYGYWNVGVSLGFLEKWSLDLRYHDSDAASSGFAPASIADERFVATLKYTF